MANVKSKDTKPELIVRRLLFSLGYRFRLHYSRLPGRPDIVLPKYHSVIFVQGCFWHHHKGCKKSRYPTSNRSFWIDKIKSNVKRDHKNVSILKKMGWSVIIIWECETKKNDLLRKIELNYMKSPIQSN